MVLSFGSVVIRSLRKCSLTCIQVDCEMTGLDFLNDRIIEIAVIITDGRLNPVDEGINYIIKTPKEVLDK